MQYYTILIKYMDGKLVTDLLVCELSKQQFLKII